MTDSSSYRGECSGPGRHQHPSPPEAVSFGFQFACLFKLGLAVFAGTLVALAIVYALLAEDLGNYTPNVLILGRTRSLVLGVAILAGLVQILVSGVPAFFISLLASHKIAGPVERLVSLFNALAGGALPSPVQFRHGDQVGRLESQFNELAETLSARHRDMVNSVQEARQELERLQELQKSGGELKLPQDSVSSLRERIERLAQAIPARAPGESASP